LGLAGLPVAASSAGGPGRAAPQNTTPPSISGSASVGAQLSANPGVWGGPAATYSVAWQRCDASGGACIPAGVSASSLTLAAGDAGSTFRVAVVATNKNGSTSATSGQTAVVQGAASPPPPPPPPPGTFAISPLPSISGTAQTGQTLNALKGSWTPTPTNYGYQWSRCNSSGSSCAPVSGATGTTYALASGDVGSTLRFAVTGSASGVTTATATSAASAVVTAPAPPPPPPPAAPANTGLPSISGTAQVGNALNASSGTWSGSPTAYAYQWTRCNSSGGGCADIGNANGSSYTPVSGDAGTTVRVTVAATNAGGTTLAVSAASSTIAAAPSSPAPSSGTYSQFGISTGWQLPWMSSGDQTTYYNDSQAAGVGMLRFDINWTSIQAGGPTSYNWAPQDAVVHGAMAHGMKILAMIAYTPAWARASGTTDKYPPTNVSDYGNFCKATAQHYSPMGVHAYEVWNEPNTGGMFAPTPDVAKYTAMLKSCYTAIKSVDSNSTVVTGGTAPAGKYNASGSSSNVNPINWLEGIYANGGKGYFDAVAHHPYSYPYAPSTVADWNAWYQMFGTTPSLRSLMVAHGDGAKQIWGTEWGAPTNGPSGSGYVSESTQAAQTTEAFKLWTSYSWAGPLFVYNGRDNGTSTSTRENFFGLLRYDWSQKPAFAAFKAAAGK
jgi:polysaccharide biosynthesis protein PslG